MDGQAFEDLFRRHRGMVERVCRRYLRDPEELRDAAQDVFLKLGRKHSLFRGEAEEGTWVYRIAINTCLDRLRALRRRRELPLESLDEMVRENLEARNEQNGVEVDLDRLLGGIHPRTRKILFLHFAEGLTYEEIAGTLGVTKSAVAKQVGRFVARMRPLRERYLQGSVT